MINPEKILRSLDDAIISDIIYKHFVDDDYVVDGNRTKHIGVIAESALVTGYDYMLKTCSKKVLDLLEVGETIHNPGENKTRSKAVVASNLNKIIDDDGLVEFLNRKDDLTIIKVARQLGVEVDGDKEDIISRIESHLAQHGLLILFEAFNPAELKSWCELQDIECASSSKRRLAKAIIYGEDVDDGSTPKKKKTSKPSKKKPVIEEGISNVDLMHHYTVTELKEFCAANDIKKGGKKREVVNRIMKFLAGDKVPSSKKAKRESGDEKEKTTKKKRKVE